MLSSPERGWAVLIGGSTTVHWPNTFRAFVGQRDSSVSPSGMALSVGKPHLVLCSLIVRKVSVFSPMHLRHGQAKRSESCRRLPRVSRREPVLIVPAHRRTTTACAATPLKLHRAVRKFETFRRCLTQHQRTRAQPPRPPFFDGRVVAHTRATIALFHASVKQKYHVIENITCFSTQ